MAQAVGVTPLDARPTRAAPCVSTLHGGRVHLDPVGPDLRPQAFALPIEDNQICLEPGHMTINAIVRYRMVWLRECRGVRLVAAHASL